MASVTLNKEFKILIADKDPQFKSTIQKTLKTHFKHISIANSGPQILDLCEKIDFDLVVVANHLPGILGIEVLRRLEHQYPKMRRILTSDHDTDAVIESALEYGMIDRFLQKPIEVHDLVWEIEFLLGLNLEPPHSSATPGEETAENHYPTPFSFPFSLGEEKQLLLNLGKSPKQ